MGEMADFYNEQVEEMEHQRFIYRTGGMSDDEAYEKGIIDELGYEANAHVSQIYTVCKHCKKPFLRWGFSKKHQKWLLYNRSGNLHECKPNITCKNCHKDGFYWRQTSKGWRLFDVKNNNVHICEKN